MQVSREVHAVGDGAREKWHLWPPLETSEWKAGSRWRVGIVSPKLKKGFMRVFSTNAEVTCLGSALRRFGSLGTQAVSHRGSFSQSFTDFAGAQPLNAHRGPHPPSLCSAGEIPATVMPTWPGIPQGAHHLQVWGRSSPRRKRASPNSIDSVPREGEWRVSL